MGVACTLALTVKLRHTLSMVLFQSLILIFQSRNCRELLMVLCLFLTFFRSASSLHVLSSLQAEQLHSLRLPFQGKCSSPWQSWLSSTRLVPVFWCLPSIGEIKIDPLLSRKEPLSSPDCIIAGLTPIQVQDSVFGLTEIPEVPINLFLQPAPITLNDSPALERINWSH